jgi:hypothetical protein
VANRLLHDLVWHFQNEPIEQVSQIIVIKTYRAVRSLECDGGNRSYPTDASGVLSFSTTINWKIAVHIAGQCVLSKSSQTEGREAFERIDARASIHSD